MKPFDLKAALAGAKVVTRDGREVKIAGYNEEIYPANIALLGWVDSDLGWCERAWFINGCYLKDEFHGFDLFMATTERKEWVVRVAYPEPISATILPANSLQKANEIASKYSNATIHEITIHE